MMLNGMSSCNSSQLAVTFYRDTVLIFHVSGHAFIDVLKIDTEGAEFDALTSFVNAHVHGHLPIGQLQLEIHAQGDHARFDSFLKWWESLEATGLRPFSFEPNLLHITGRECAKPEVVEVRCFFWFLIAFWGARVNRIVSSFGQYSFINIRGSHALVSDAFN
jgi:hypothetical protein